MPESSPKRKYKLNDSHLSKSKEVYCHPLEQFWGKYETHFSPHLNEDNIAILDELLKDNNVSTSVNVIFINFYNILCFNIKFSKIEYTWR